jgi:glutaredoxin
MEYEQPTKNGFFVYSKSNCVFCTHVRHAIIKFVGDKEIEYLTINCDKYLQESRDKFIEFAKYLTRKDKITFPMVFFNGKFIGGCDDTLRYIEFNSEF